jgi:uracil-DNA glycosylase
MDATSIQIEPSWKRALLQEFSKPYFTQLATFVKNEYRNEQVFPTAKQVFRALDCTPLDTARVVILGQDPYHGPGQANGLCFSVNEGVPNPPSLVNIFKEIQNDLSLALPKSGDLVPWASQGVMLLNDTLTVRAHAAGSHQNQGWEIFTDAIISVINVKCENVVFMLWGNHARKKASKVDRCKHLVLESPHPSPLSAYRGFFGNGHFSSANAFLQEKGLRPIDWSL